MNIGQKLAALDHSNAEIGSSVHVTGRSLVSFTLSLSSTFLSHMPIPQLSNNVTDLIGSV